MQLFYLLPEKGMSFLLFISKNIVCDCSFSRILVNDFITKLILKRSFQLTSILKVTLPQCC